ncbi:MAG: PAS domain-containing protein [Proteobacteria bacterium]|nr:PAS domain-containing protein [Pseudomonadota bacterium]
MRKPREPATEPSATPSGAAPAGEVPATPAALVAAFVEHSPVACFVKDLDGRYRFLNPRCGEIYGIEIGDWLGRSDEELFPAAAAQFRASDREVLERGRVTISEQHADTPTGTRHFLTHKFPVRDAAGRIAAIAGAAIDVTELRTADARLRSVVERMPVLMDAFDADGRIVVWNEECARVTGYSAAEILGHPDAMALLYPDPAYRAAMLSEALELRHQQYSRVYELTAKDGTPRAIEWFNVGARLPVPGWLEWSIGIDVTERVRLEAALHEATVREQRRLGHDLHDGLGQELTGLALLAQSLARRHADADPALAADLAELAALAARAIATCRSVAQGLAPVEEPRLGLAQALRRLTSGFAVGAEGPRIDFSVQQSAPLQIPLEASNHLYRIAQEALTNAARHAGATRIRVELAADANRVAVTVRDDGRGFRGEPGDGMGLRTMRTRADAIGARLTVQAAPGSGTLVTCECANRPSSPRPRG